MNAFLVLLISNVVIAGGLAVLAFCIERIYKNPQLTHAAWLLALAKLITPPFVSVPFLLPFDDSPQPLSHDPRVVASSLDHTESNAGPADTPLITSQSISVIEKSVAPIAEPFTTRNRLWEFAITNYAQGLLIFWAWGVLVLAAIAWRRHRLLLRLVREASEASDKLICEASIVADRMCLRRYPTLRVTTARVNPLVTIVNGKSLVLLPADLINRLDGPQRQSILAHEFAHVCRRDHLVRGFELVVLLLYWWNPLAWWASRRLRQAAEECCDARVISAFPANRRNYGYALLRAVEFLTEGKAVAPVMASAFGELPFHRRIEMIMKPSKRSRTSWSLGTLLLLMATAVLPVAAQTASEEQPNPRRKGVADSLKTGSEKDRPKGPLKKKGRVDGKKAKEPKPETPRTPKSPDGQKEVVLIPDGFIKLVDDVLIPARFNGIVEEIIVRPGARVKKGDVLIKLQSDDAKLELTRVIAALRAAQPNELIVTEAELKQKLATDTLTRIKSLRDKGVVGPHEYERAAQECERAKLGVAAAKRAFEVQRQRYKALEATVELAQRRVEQCVCHSPINGVVLDVNHQVAETVEAGAALCRVVNLERLSAVAYVQGPPKREWMGSKVKVSVRYPNNEIHTALGEIVFVSPVAEPHGQVLVRAAFDNVSKNGSHLFAPGMKAELIVLKKD